MVLEYFFLVCFCPSAEVFLLFSFLFPMASGHGCDDYIYTKHIWMSWLFLHNHFEEDWKKAWEVLGSFLDFSAQGLPFCCSTVLYASRFSLSLSTRVVPYHSQNSQDPHRALFGILWLGWHLWALPMLRNDLYVFPLVSFCWRCNDVCWGKVVIHSPHYFNFILKN